MDWGIVDRPGYFGSSRDEMQKGFDSKYGSGNWRICFYL